MKKIIGTLFVAVAALFMAMPAQAQIKWGVKGGVNMAKIDWDASIDANKENSTGFFIGPMAEFTLPIVGLGVDAALLYSQRGKEEWKQQGFEIPVNLKYTIGLGSTLGIFFAAGPDFFYNWKDLDLGNLDGEKKDVQVGINLGAGVKLLRHLQVGVNYQIPMGDSFKVENIKFKTNTWQVSAAILF